MSIVTDESAMVPMLVPVVLAAIVILTRRARRSDERARGTYRVPVTQVASVGWLPLSIGAYFLGSSTITLLTLGPDPPEGISTPQFEVMVGAPFFLIGAAMTVGLARRRITVWGEHLRYLPPFSPQRIIWAMDAVEVQRMTTPPDVTTFWVTGQNRRKAYWEISAFPPRTMAVFRHGVHHNKVQGAAVRRPTRGIQPFLREETLEMPDGTLATWHAGRTVHLDVLASAPDEQLLQTVEDRLITVLTPLSSSARLGGRTRDGAHGGSVYGAQIDWRRRPGTTAIDARVRADGDEGLAAAGQAYSFLCSQLTQGAREHLRAEVTTRAGRARAADAVTITHRESWT